MRQPAVANRFYPGSPKALKRAISEFLPSGYEGGKERSIAVVSPHAGYVYSGELAAKTLSSVEIPKTVVIIGTNHRGAGLPVALSTGNWNMPFGPVPVDRDFSTLLLANSCHIKQDEIAHNSEHSLEVQVPFRLFSLPTLATLSRTKLPTILNTPLRYKSLFFNISKNNSQSFPWQSHIFLFRRVWKSPSHLLIL